MNFRNDNEGATRLSEAPRARCTAHDRAETEQTIKRTRSARCNYTGNYKRYILRLSTCRM